MRPRRIVHRGRVMAAGLWLRGPRATLQPQVLRLWLPGTQVLATGPDGSEHEGYALRWPNERPVHAEECAGAPLTARGPHLAAAPLDDDELPRAPPSLLLVSGGALVVEPQREPVAIEAWLDVADTVLFEVSALGARREAPAMIRTASEADARTVLGLPAPAAERAELLSALRQAREGRPVGQGGPGGGDGGAPAWLGWLRHLVGWLAAARATGSDTAEPPAAGALAQRSWLSALHAWLATMIAQSALARVLGRRQAAYLERMMEMFRSGDLDQALRHAIPLGGDAEKLASLALGVPSPRSDIRLRAGPRVPASSSIGLPSEWMESLEQTYRRAAAQLEAAGQIEQAAFVWVELLGKPDRAVSLLERHGRHRLAAELAEAHGLAAGWVVGLWFGARDRRRAVAVAIRTGAFADAVQRLERAGDDEAAGALRLLWGERLASAGDFALAVDAVWPLPRAHALARRWIELGLEAGGAVRGKLLARQLEISPESAPDVAAQIGARLRDRDPGARDERLAFATHLRAGPMAEALGRQVARAMLADGSSAAEGAAPFERLRTFTLGSGFGEDLPRGAPRPPPPFTEREIAPLDRGAHAIHDAAWLPDGRALVALGELGLALVGRDGAVETRFAQAAHRLVLHGASGRAIVLAPRGPRAYRLARIDALRRRSEAWCDVELDDWSPTFDGQRWVVAVGRDVVAIDAQDAGWSGLWRMGGLGQVVALAAEGDRLTIAVRSAGEPWLLAYDLAGGVTLRWRKPVPIQADGLRALAFGPDGRAAATFEDGATPVRLAVMPPAGRGVDREAAEIGTTATGHAAPHELHVFAEGIALVVQETGGVRLIWLDPTGAEARARLELGGSRRVSLTMTAGALAIADDLGRLLRLDVHRNLLDRDVRL